MQRLENRSVDEKRNVSIELDYYDYADGSCVLKMGGTHVLCVASIEERIPPFMKKGCNKGWITAEYSMLPGSSSERVRRERSKVGGRTQEIQRLIGRTLRSVFSLEGWGERSLLIDCDVLRADGGTRTASITGAFIVAVQAFKKLREKNLISNPTAAFPVKDYLSAISVGIVRGTPVLDLNYQEDSTADTDMNLVMTSGGEIVEIQGTAEKKPMNADEFSELLKLAKKGTFELCELQKEILGELTW